MTAGIYVFEHVGSGRKYVGSAMDTAKRRREHLSQLRRGIHPSRHLQAAWTKHGEQAFTFRPLLICSVDNLLMYEQRCIDGYRATDRRFGYNLTPIAGSQLGFRHSEATKDKVRAARAKQVFSAETRALWSKNRTGRKMPAWFGEYMRRLKTGSRQSAATREKIGAFQRGRPKPLAEIEARSKLTVAKAAEIRALYASGHTQTDLAKRYGVRPSTVCNVVRGKHWAVAPDHIGD